MASARALLVRVARLEQARAAPQSPIEAMFGSFDAFEAEARAGVDAGKLDSDDMPVVLASLRRWHVEGLWGMWRSDHGWQRNG